MVATAQIINYKWIDPIGIIGDFSNEIIALIILASEKFERSLNVSRVGVTRFRPI